ncbi:SLD5 [Cyberlindnera jadinii]|uniref:DNA replication complex GINS protein SLD5 n=1 Tax=Cyberlindnera jadinii (strain ATCC 18201 / CBS 1600 / BCRC 20928 / JCM 3617 / NBRC 0987 / NRRL Y-1542) TaxID=983966 RepID=A0A0H5C1F1_CYBJN|nr:SLD5 [Cyberlindnera jadinii]
MEFDDILEEFERETRSHKYNEVEVKRSDFQELQNAWISERMCPELLDYKQSLIDRILSRIRVQIEFIEMNSIELQTTERDIKLQLMIIESELDRVNFILRSYLRTRLSKVDKFTIFIRNDEELVQRLSPAETQYMESHFRALIDLYNSLFLSQLPEQLQALDDTGGGISMIEEPDLDRPVFVKVINDTIETIVIGEEEIDLIPGSIYLIRYSAVQRFVYNQDVLLI